MTVFSVEVVVFGGVLKSSLWHLRQEIASWNWQQLLMPLRCGLHPQLCRQHGRQLYGGYVVDVAVDFTGRFGGSFIEYAMDFVGSFVVDFVSAVL